MQRTTFFELAVYSQQHARTINIGPKQSTLVMILVGIYKHVGRQHDDGGQNKLLKINKLCIAGFLRYVIFAALVDENKRLLIGLSFCPLAERSCAISRERLKTTNVLFSGNPTRLKTQRLAEVMKF